MTEKSKTIRNLKTYTATYSEALKLNYTLEDCNTERPMQLYKALKDMGYDVDIEAFWAMNGKGEGFFQVVVNDYSHSDIEGNNYCYIFDPNTGNDIE